MKWKILKSEKVLLLLILFLASWFRFSGLSWGLPYCFHPDEWNMAAAVTRLSGENRLNPEFFAYGQLPLYLSYFSAKAYNLIPWINPKTVDLAKAVFFLRFWSGLAGVVSVYFVHLISRRFMARFSLLAGLLAAFTPGLLQSSHFGTTESILTLCFLAVVYFSLEIIPKPKLKYFLFSAIFLAIALSSKITGLIFILPFFTAAGWRFFRSQSFKEKLMIFSFGLSSLALALSLTFLFSPYLLLNFAESRRILTYESLVAAGKIAVFYTRQFTDTSPVLFQLQKIFPFALGWPIFILGTLGLALSFFLGIRLKEARLYLLNFAFLTYFLSQAFWFTKWTRFLTPVFPFFAVFAALFLHKLSTLTPPKIFFIFYLLFFISLCPGLVFSTLYFKPDIRLTASQWIYENIPTGAKIFSETGNVVDLPVPPSGYPIVSFDFYHLDEDPRLFSQLIDGLVNSGYLFVPSRRIFANHQRLPENYPLTAKYYDLLFSGKLGFTEIKTFYPFPRLVPSDESAEETWSVFDHPIIRIYKKEIQLTRTQYQQLFLNN